MISDCKKLTSLEGCPDKIEGSLNSMSNINLTSLAGCPRVIRKNLNLAFCSGIKSFDNLPEQASTISIHSVTKEPIPLLLFLKVQGLSEIIGLPTNAEKVIKKYIGKPMTNARIIQCQSELIDAGLEEWASFGDD
jgi:hypothetical protein